jgi:predicted phage terminase large subunit-like protein
MATSVGGVLTGRGADIIIIDDALKPEEALSETQRKRVNDWYDNTLLSRLNSKENGCIIIIMQRLHQDDLVGHVLEQEAWEVVNFPAITEEVYSHPIESIFGTKLFTRQVGEPLHAERESLELLQSIRERMGEYNFLSQYQQTPIPVGGAMVKRDWLKYYEPGTEPAQFDRVFQSWDTNNKATEFSDYSVCTTWGLKGKNLYLLNVYRRRLDYPDLKRSVIEQARIWRPTVILIEDKASGTQLLQELKREGIYNVKAYNPAGNDKVMRLHAQTAFIENGQLFLPTQAHWLNDYVQELTSFPGSKYDDQVDSTTQALEWHQMRPRGFFS